MRQPVPPILVAVFAAALCKAAAAPPGEAHSRLGPAQSAFELPAALREISGLAPAGQGRVFAHNDEFAAAYEVDLLTGKLVRTLRFGLRPIVGDFEGIAVSNGRIYLVSSDGRIVSRALEGSNADRNVEVVDTGLGKICEIEGLAPADKKGGFFLLCKRTLRKKDDNALRIFFWSPRKGLRLAIETPFERIDASASELRPSDLSRDAATGRFYVLESHAAALIELSPAGEPLAYFKLKAKDHPQPEGLALLAGGRIAIGDEGGQGKGRLSLYQRPPEP